MSRCWNGRGTWRLSQPRWSWNCTWALALKLIQKFHHDSVSKFCQSFWKCWKTNMATAQLFLDFKGGIQRLGKLIINISTRNAVKCFLLYKMKIKLRQIKLFQTYKLFRVHPISQWIHLILNSRHPKTLMCTPKVLYVYTKVSYVYTLS